MDGVLYCKPHFEQLFKETGNFHKKFQTCKTRIFPYYLITLLFPLIFQIMRLIIRVFPHASSAGKPPYDQLVLIPYPPASFILIDFLDYFFINHDQSRPYAVSSSESYYYYV